MKLLNSVRNGISTSTPKGKQFLVDEVNNDVFVPDSKECRVVTDKTLILHDTTVVNPGRNKFDTSF